MAPQILQTEERFNALLPLHRALQGPSQEILDASEAWSQAVWAQATQQGPAPMANEQLVQGIQLAKYPVFICGVHRSGTTLVRDLLDGHPQLTVLPSEGTYFTSLEAKMHNLPENDRAAFLGMEWLRRLANPINQPPYWLLGRSNETTSPHIDFARYFMAWWKFFADNEKTQWPHTAVVLAYASCTGRQNAKLWVDKTPTNERFLKRIWKEMPDAKIVHVIRHPLDTLTSRKRMEPSLDLRKALIHLKTSFCAALKPANIKDERFMLLRYEVLCENPATNIERLASFLNIEVLPVLFQPTVVGMVAEANSSFSLEAPKGKILKPNQHRQEETLSKTEQQLLAAYIRKPARKLGYTLPKVGFLYGVYLRLVYRLL